MVRQLIALKAKMTWNTFTRQTWVLVMVVLGLVYALGMVASLTVAVVGSILWGDAEVPLAVLTLGGAGLVLAWWVVPAVFSGMDNTLDPERFAPYVDPSPRFASGLVAATGVGVAGILSTLLSLLPALGWAVAGNPAAALAALLVAPLALATAFTWARALSTWIGTRLRATSARRDMSAAVSSTLFILVLAPAGLWIQWLVRDFSPDAVVRSARIGAWTPFGAAFGVPAAIAEGDWLTAAARLALAVLTLAVGFRLWLRVLADAMTGVADPVSESARDAIAEGRRLIDPSKEGAHEAHARAAHDYLPRVQWWQMMGLSGPTASMAARTARYWVRDARLVVSLTSPMLFIILAVMWDRMAGMPGGLSIFWLYFMPIVQGTVIGSLAQYDSTSLWISVSSAITGRQERAGRLVGSLPISAGLMVAGVLAYALLTGRGPGDTANLVAMAIALLMCSAALALVVGSVWVYPVQPPGTSPMSTRGTGHMMATILIQSAALLGALLVGLPVIISTSLSQAGVIAAWAGPLVSVPWALIIAVGGVWVAGRLWDANDVAILTKIRSWPGH